MRLQPVPAVLAAIFAAVIAINLVMVYFAVASAPGFVTDRAFERGKAYNADLAAARAQETLGWAAAVDFEHGVAVARLTARDGSPLEGLHVVLAASRPVGPVPDIVETLVEAGRGTYVAIVSLPKGQWHVEIAARKGDASFRSGNRVMVR